MNNKNQNNGIFNTSLAPGENVFNVPKLPKDNKNAISRQAPKDSEIISKKFSKKERKNEIDEYKYILIKDTPNPLWVSVSEAAKFGGITTKTVRRAIQQEKITYKVIKNRYLIDFRSVVLYLHTKTKLKNKLNELGVGQYIKKWR